MHCAMIQAGEIQIIVGDAAREGAGGRQYCGLWSLTSVHRVFNAFGNSFAGLIPGHLRGKGPVLEQPGERTCLLRHAACEARPYEATAYYTARAPHYIDHELAIRWLHVERPLSMPYGEVCWNSYINCPEDPRIHYLSGGGWHRYQSPSHGVASRIAPSWLSPQRREPMPDPRPGFLYDWYGAGFDEPFFYGRVGEMALVHVFDAPERLRFYLSPSGGGESLLPGSTCPAWDFLWIVPGAQWEAGREYRFRMRLVYKRYEGDEDVLAEVRRAQDELGFAPRA